MSGYDLVRPCSNCPFRQDKPFYLDPERAEEIADSLRRGAEFHCHKTVHYEEERWDEYEGEEGMEAYYNPLGDEQHCAGALIIMEKNGESSQMMRIAERLGVYDRKKLDMESPVYASLEEFIDAMYELDCG